MALIPPIPALPQLPFELPFGFTIDPSHILRLPPQDDFCVCCVKQFLNCLIMEKVARAGCDWMILINRKAYYLKWRDVAPRPPWTQQVWDIFRLLPDACGCPSQPRGLGWQWCWAEAINTIRQDVLHHWQEGNLSGGGQTVVSVGTNAFQPAVPGIAQIGPVLYLDASDPSTLTLVGGGIVQWSDKSTRFNHAVQPSIVNRPVLDPGVLNGLDTIRFDASLEQYLTIKLKAQTDWHLFVVGRFLFNGAQPRGTFFSATGFELPFGGIEGKIYQNASVQPTGTPFTVVGSSEIPMVGTTLGNGIYGILEWKEKVSSEGGVSIGVNAFDQQVFSGDTSEDFWDPTRQTFGESIPLLAAIGRSNWGINPARAFDYLDGNIGQILLYPRVLSEGERVQVLNVLRAKWGLGAPLPFPPSP